MNRVPLSIPELALISGTRAALGAGVGLLLADRLSDDQRRAVGWALVGVGVVTTIPIAVQLFGSMRGGNGGNGGGRTDVREAPAGGWLARDLSE
jgi:hypothetical protein